jgi:hypothetical protein
MLCGLLHLYLSFKIYPSSCRNAISTPCILYMVEMPRRLLILMAGLDLHEPHMEFSCQIGVYLLWINLGY